MSLKEINHIRWNLPPSKNRKGMTRGQYDIKHVIVIESDLFGDVPTLITSDLHSQCGRVFQLLDEYIKLEKFFVISAGDMAGPPIFGYDGDPTDDYEYMLDRADEFYFVQGNHDLPHFEGKHLTFRNGNGNQSALQDGKKIESRIGTIGSVNGTISTKAHPYKMHEKKYLKYISTLLKNSRPRILVTHETPALPVKYKNLADETYVGNDKLFALVNTHKPKVHIYGHCHHPRYYNNINGVHYLNVDARVLLFKPKSMELDELIKKELTDVYT